MRIISGKYKGRNISGYNIDGTRPTMDRVKESVVGSIQTRIKNSICLDLFAGSGSVGLELISNGAKECYLVDNNKKVIDTISYNIDQLCIEEPCHLCLCDYKEALKKFKLENIKFDIIFLDPPYKSEYLNACLKLIYECELLNNNGIIVCEFEDEKFECKYNLVKEKKYGSKQIRIYEND